MLLFIKHYKRIGPSDLAVEIVPISRHLSDLVFIFPGDPPVHLWY